MAEDSERVHKAHQFLRRLSGERVHRLSDLHRLKGWCGGLAWSRTGVKTLVPGYIVSLCPPDVGRITHLMDELDNLATDPLGSSAPGQDQVSTALQLLGGLLAEPPTRTQRWERRDHGNGLTYRLWDALPIVHAVAAGHRIAEVDAVHAVQAAVRRLKTDDDVIDALSEHLAELGVSSLKDFMGRTIEFETHYPLNLGAYAVSAVDSDAVQSAYMRTATVLRERSLAAASTAA